MQNSHCNSVSILEYQDFDVNLKNRYHTALVSGVKK